MDNENVKFSIWSASLLPKKGRNTEGVPDIKITIICQPLTCPCFSVISSKGWVYHIEYRSVPVKSAHMPTGALTRRGREEELEYYCVIEAVKYEWRQQPWETAHLLLFTMLWVRWKCVSLTRFSSFLLLFPPFSPLPRPGGTVAPTPPKKLQEVERV